MATLLGGCASTDLTRPVDRSMGLALGIYSQDGRILSRSDLAGALELERSSEEAMSGYWAWSYSSWVALPLGLACVIGGLATRRDPDVDDRVSTGLTIGGGVVLGVGVLAEFVARFLLDAGVKAHNGALIVDRLEREVAADR